MPNNFRPMSITIRVVLFVAVTAVFSLSLIGSLINSSIDHHFLQQDTAELKVISHSIETSLSQQHNSKEQLTAYLSKAVVGHHGVYFQVNSQQGQLIYRNSTVDFSGLNIPLSTNLSADRASVTLHTADQSMYRVLLTDYKNQQANYRIIAAIDMSFHMQFLTQFKQSLWVIMFGAGLLVLLTAWFAVHQGLNPIRGLSRKMQKIQTDNFEIRLAEQTVPVELIDMVRSFNLMLDRLQNEFHRLANFSTDIAHELRTPLTNIITQTQVGLSKPRALEDYQELLFSNLEELDRLTKMVSDMLWLAKSQNGLIKPDQQILNSDTEVEALFEYFDALAEDNNITFTKQGECLDFYCEKLHFRQLLSNLISNALRYTGAGLSITVNIAKTKDGQVCLSVINPGEPIPAEHLPYLFDRFYRPDKSRQRHSDGAGLGLAIVKALVEANGGKINVTSDNVNTSFNVYFNQAQQNNFRQ
ncbi:MAG: heavy metal sensor histidine kinase [Thalassotalea sp.]